MDSGVRVVQVSARSDLATTTTASSNRVCVCVHAGRTDGWVAVDVQTACVSSLWPVVVPVVWAAGVGAKQLLLSRCQAQCRRQHALTQLTQADTG